MFIKMDILSGTVYEDIGLNKYKVFNIGADGRLFQVIAHNRLNMLVSSSCAVPIGRGHYRRQLSIFDMQVTVEYDEFLALYFEVVDYELDSVAWRVETWSGEGKNVLGVLRYEGGGLDFNGVAIGSESIKTLYSKCLLLA